jgi:hypothetical protein
VRHTLALEVTHLIRDVITPLCVHMQRPAVHATHRLHAHASAHVHPHAPKLTMP